MINSCICSSVLFFLQRSYYTKLSNIDYLDNLSNVGKVISDDNIEFTIINATVIIWGYVKVLPENGIKTVKLPMPIKKGCPFFTYDSLDATISITGRVINNDTLNIKVHSSTGRYGVFYFVVGELRG